jgi:hypothetical protein
MRAPRLWFEMFEQAARDVGANDYIDALLERFAGLDADILRALAVDGFPPVPPPPLVEDGDHLLGAIVEVPAERVRLYAEVNGARR